MAPPDSACVAVETRGRGRLLATASSAGITGEAGNPAYSASKRGSSALSKCSPSSSARTASPSTRSRQARPATPRYLAIQKARRDDDATPMAAIHEGRARPRPIALSEPADIAAAFAFLASDEAGYTTGRVIFVDGGFTLV